MHIHTVEYYLRFSKIFFFILFFFNENTQKAAQRFYELQRPLKEGRELLNYAKFLPPVEAQWVKNTIWHLREL